MKILLGKLLLWYEQHIRRRKVRLFNPRDDLLALGGTWEGMIAAKLRCAGLKVMPLGWGVEERPVGYGRSPPDFEVQYDGSLSTFVEVTGTEKDYKGYKEIFIQSGKVELVAQHSPLVIVRYFGPPIAESFGQVFWIEGEKCVGYPSQYAPWDVDQNLARVTYIPTREWHRGMESLVAYLKRA